ncbi:hypothetical protein LB505_004142 [Fusarium chuoi]|nr:hypothetical protein LB505_004142 [Fusarium chuoi]
MVLFSKLVASHGEFCFSHTAITSTNALFISNMASTLIVFPITGAAVFNLRSSYGTRTTPAYMSITLPTIDSLRKKVIGVLLDLLSTAECLMYHGRAAADPSAKMILPTSLPIFASSRMRRVFCGTTSPTTIPRRRLGMLGSRIRVPPAI